MLEFMEITSKNWDKLSSYVMDSELEYQESIQTSYEDYNNIFSAGDAIGKIGLVNGKYAGNIIGYPPTDIEMEEYGLTRGNEKHMYLFNIIIDKEFRGQGLGFNFIAEFLKESKTQGYTKMIGHFRPNGSYALIKKLGAIDLAHCKNWEETGEDFMLCELNLTKLQLLENSIQNKN